MKIALAALVILLAGPAVAQEHQHQHQHRPSPYARLQQRDIKALSEQQIADLRAGRGMGLALVAELNGYPVPMHVLELAEGLQLSADQRQRVQHLYASMKAETIAAGEFLIAAERALDQEFAARRITSHQLMLLTKEIGVRQAELRALHLKYHLTTADLLTPYQKDRYAELRGYR